MPPSTTKRRRPAKAAAAPQPPPTPQPVPTGVAPDRGLGLLYLIGGLIALVAAVTLLVEKIALIEDPDYIPSCTLSPILSCGSIMSTWQAELFGIPNPIIGVMAFPVVAAIGASLVGGVRFPQWFAVATQVGVTFGVVFIHWLIYQSLYVIGALCPYCMVVWVAMIPIFWFTTIATLRGLRSSGRIAGRWGRVVDTVIEYRGPILTGWFLLILALIAVRFWDYWVTLV